MACTFGYSIYTSSFSNMFCNMFLYVIHIHICFLHFQICFIIVVNFLYFLFTRNWFIGSSFLFSMTDICYVCLILMNFLSLVLKIKTKNHVRFKSTKHMNDTVSNHNYCCCLYWSQMEQKIIKIFFCQG